LRALKVGITTFIGAMRASSNYPGFSSMSRQQPTHREVVTIADSPEVGGRFSQFAYKDDGTGMRSSNADSTVLNMASKKAAPSRIIASDDEEIPTPGKPRIKPVVTSTAVTQPNPLQHGKQSSSSWNDDDEGWIQPYSMSNTSTMNLNAIRRTSSYAGSLAKRKRADNKNKDNSDDEEELEDSDAEREKLTKGLSLAAEHRSKWAELENAKKHERSIRSQKRQKVKVLQDKKSQPKKPKVISLTDDDEEEEDEFSDSGSDSNDTSEDDEDSGDDSDIDNRHRRKQKHGSSKSSKASDAGVNPLEDDFDFDYDDWQEDAGKAEIKRKAKRILNTCLSFSSGLRRTLNNWSSTGNSVNSSPATSTTSSSAATSLDDSYDNSDCVNLVSIAQSRPDPTEPAADQKHQELIAQSDVQILCPILTLKEYQLVGINWLKLLDEHDINGVLADDMGLGKTVQTISFLAWRSLHIANFGLKKRPHLVVVPASTLSNWKNEFDKFCPSFRVVVYHGSQMERLDLRQSIQSWTRDGDVDVIITNYTIFERESNKDDRKFLYGLSFEYLILDEAHCLKNASTARYAKLNNVRSKHRLLLSGTPVQNDVSELLALLSFLMPRTFSRSDCDLLLSAFEWDQLKDKSKGATARSSDNSSTSIKKLRSMLAPFVLRRVKSDVLSQLTDKIMVVHKVNMFEAQRKLYTEVIHSYANKRKRSELIAAAEAKTDALLDGKKSNKSKSSKSKKQEEPVEIDLSGGTDVDGDGGDIQFVGSSSDSGITITNLASLENSLSASESRHLFTALRKAANHPLLLRVRYQDPAVLDRIARVAIAHDHYGPSVDFQRVRTELNSYSDYDIHQLCVQYGDYLGELQLPAQALYDSPKMHLLQTLLPTLLVGSL
jgi:SNF2 family DNA or RNA helicase